MTTEAEKRRRYLKALYGKQEGALPDMPSPKDPSPVLGPEYNRRALADSEIADYEARQKAYGESLQPAAKAVPEAPVDTSGFNSEGPAEDEENEESDADDGDPRIMTKSPGLLDRVKEIGERFINQDLGYRGNSHPSVKVGTPAKTVKPPPAASKFDAAYTGDPIPPKLKAGFESAGVAPEPEVPAPFDPMDPKDAAETASIEGDMFGAEAPTQAPDDLPAAASMPDIAKVDNSQVAPIVNATSAVSSNLDAQKAVQRERAPQDDSAYWAALKTVANASGRNAHGVGYYDEKIAQEKQAQKDWQARLAGELKMKYGVEQNKMREASRDARLNQQIEATNTRAQLGRDAQDKRQGKALAQQADNFTTKDAEDLAKKAPSTKIMRSARNVDKILRSGKPIPGFGKVLNTLKSITPEKLAMGIDAVVTGDMSPEEANQYRQTWGLMLNDIFEDAGKQLTPQELVLKLRAVGASPGQGQEALANGLNDIVETTRAKARQNFLSHSEAARKRAITSGAISPEDREFMGLPLDPEEENDYQ